MRSNFRGFGLISQSFGEVSDVDFREFGLTSLNFGEVPGVTGTNPFKPTCRLDAPTFLSGKRKDLYCFFFVLQLPFPEYANILLFGGLAFSVFSTCDQPLDVCFEMQVFFSCQ